jgi:hypothetical protein
MKFQLNSTKANKGIGKNRAGQNNISMIYHLKYFDGISAE